MIGKNEEGRRGDGKSCNNHVDRKEVLLDCSER
jgi:hypothetical protein